MAAEPSAADATAWPRAASCHQLRRPTLDFGPEPQLRTAATKIEHRSRHIHISLLIHAHGVPQVQAEDLSDSVRIDQIFGGDVRTRRSSVHPSPDPSDGRARVHP
jgi:hypothetical protein